MAAASRVSGDAQAQAIVNIVKTNVGLNKLQARRMDWASLRGVRLYKEYAWSDGDKKMTFADMRAAIGNETGGKAAGVGRAIRPCRRLDYVVKREEWKADHPSEIPLRDQTALVDRAQLMVPVETSPEFRPANLLFIREGTSLRIYDTKKGAFEGEPIPLGTRPQTVDTVLVGVMHDMAVLCSAIRPSA